MHGAIMASFQQPKPELGRVLWRVDNDPNLTWLYVVSRYPPEFSHIIEQAGLTTSNDECVTRRYGPLLDRLAVGQKWAFRLAANPSRSDSSRDGRRFGHVTAAQQEQWLLDRVSNWGFDIAAVNGRRELVVRDRVVQRFRRGGEQVTLAKATFDGVLEVASVASLREVLVNGAGHGKAYGCGLITLARSAAKR